MSVNSIKKIILAIIVMIGGQTYLSAQMDTIQVDSFLFLNDSTEVLVNDSFANGILWEAYLNTDTSINSFETFSQENFDYLLGAIFRGEDLDSIFIGGLNYRISCLNILDNNCTGCDFNDLSLLSSDYWSSEQSNVSVNINSEGTPEVTYSSYISCPEYITIGAATQSCLYNTSGPYSYSHGYSNAFVKWIAPLAEGDFDPNIQTIPVVPGWSDNCRDRSVRMGFDEFSQDLLSNGDYEYPYGKIRDGQAQSITKSITISEENQIMSFDYSYIVTDRHNHTFPYTYAPQFWVEIKGHNNPNVDLTYLPNTQNPDPLISRIDLGNGSNILRVENGSLSSLYNSARNLDLYYSGWNCGIIDFQDIPLGTNIDIILYNRSEVPINANISHLCDDEVLDNGYVYIDNLRNGECTTTFSSSIFTIGNYDSNMCQCEGEICFNYTLPEFFGESGIETGELEIELNIVYGGVVIQTFLSDGDPAISGNQPLTNGNLYCFEISDLLLQNGWEGVDINAVGTFTTDCSYELEVGNAKKGLNDISNDDVDFGCPDVGLITFASEFCADELIEGTDGLAIFNIENFEFYEDNMVLQANINDAGWVDYDINDWTISSEGNFSQYLTFEKNNPCPLDCSDENFNRTHYLFRIQYNEGDCVNGDSSVLYSNEVNIDVSPPLQPLPYYNQTDYVTCHRSNVPVTTSRPCFKGTNGQIGVDVDCIIGGTGPYKITLFRDNDFNEVWNEECVELVGESIAHGGNVLFHYEDNCCPSGFTEFTDQGCLAQITYPDGYIAFEYNTGLYVVPDVSITPTNNGCPAGYTFDNVNCYSGVHVPNGYVVESIVLNNVGGYFAYQNCDLNVEIYQGDYHLIVEDLGECGGTFDTLISLFQLDDLTVDFEEDPVYWCENENLVLDIDDLGSEYIYTWTKKDPADLNGPGRELIGTNEEDPNRPKNQLTLYPESCAGGIYHVSITNPFENGSGTCTVERDVEVVDFNPPPLSLAHYEDAVGIGAVKYRSSWLSDFNDVSVDNPELLKNLRNKNPYASGQAGFFKVYQSYDYLVDERRQFNDREANYIDHNGTVAPNDLVAHLQSDGVIGIPEDMNAPSSPVIYKTMTKGFAWNNPKLATCAPEWTFNNEITKYNPYNFETENMDILGRYSSALYGYDGKLTTAVAANASYKEIAFESFEEYLPNYETTIQTFNQNDIYTIPVFNVPSTVMGTINGSGNATIKITIDHEKLQCASTPQSTFQGPFVRVNIGTVSYLYDLVHNGGIVVVPDFQIDVFHGDKVSVNFGGFFTSPSSCNILANCVSVEVEKVPSNIVHQFNNTTGNFDFVNENVNGEREYLTPYKVIQGFGQYVLIDLPYNSVCEDNAAEGFENEMMVRYAAESYEFNCREQNNINEVFGPNTQALIRPDPCLSDNTMLILQGDKSSLPGFHIDPDVQYWGGFVYGVKTALSDNTATNWDRISFTDEDAHTGKVSMKIVGATNDEPVSFDHNELELAGGKDYLLSAWVRCPQDFDDESPIELRTTNKDNNTGIFISIGGLNEQFFMPSGHIVEGWQRLEAHIKVPETGGVLKVSFDPANDMFVDDIRLHPMNGGMQTYVYDLQRYRLAATLDHNNYATLYKYDDEGNLFHVAKETVEGVKTIQVSNAYIKPTPTN